MSQNKTVVPGMSGAGQNNEDPQNFYVRENVGGGDYSKGTYVPGMQTAPILQVRGDVAPVQQLQNRKTIGGKPVVGFLYSISRQGIGEYWPLHIGSNTIGSSPKCNVCLREGTISGEHAVLVVRKMKNPEKTIASLCDSRSTNGTMLNGTSLAFNAVECKNNDVIVVGENYQLVLLLVDTAGLGLTISDSFMPLDGTQQDPIDSINNMDAPVQMPDPYSPFNNGNSADGTVGLDGRTENGCGGTMSM